MFTEERQELMKAARIQLSPLTPEERQFAELNHYLVEQFLYWNRLDPDDWYDVVIFRYLQSVKKWLMRPELHRYKFSSLLKQGLLSAVRNEKNKQARRIQTLSLDDIIPGGGGCNVSGCDHGRQPGLCQLWGI